MEGLVLSRKKNEVVVIDLRRWGLGLLKVLNTGTDHGETRLLFSGDKQIKIHRSEVYDEIERNKPAGAVK